MKNFEKYIESIAKVLTTQDCEGMQCDKCVLGNVCDRQDEEYTKKWLLAEYKEPIRLTHDEYVILKNLPSWCKWIAKDKYTMISTVFEEKPSKFDYIWGCNEMSQKLSLFDNLFQFVKWEDEEPYEIAKLIADYEKENGNEKD